MEKMEPKRRTNWSANITYASDVVHEVTSIAQIQALFKSQEKMKPVGTGHTFNSITDTPNAFLSLQRFPELLHLDAAARTVTISADVTYDKLCPFLHNRGFALPNLASITELSVVGACSTAAHGSGDGNGNLATAIAALEIVTGDGEVVKLSRDLEIFSGAVVGLGALGVVTELTLDLEPMFTMRQWIYENLPIVALKEHFDAIMSTGYSVSMFTDWQGGRISSVWVKSRDEEGEFSAPELLFGAKRQKENLNMNFGAHVEHCNEQMGLPGPSYERLPHFRPGFLAPVGNELQTEYFVPRYHAVAAIFAVESLRDEITPHLFISEIRSIAGDEFWMSPCYGRDSVSIHFTWKHHESDVRRLMPLIERALAPFDPRPHWGKLFVMSPAELQSKYAKLDDFLELAARFDPRGKLRNRFLDTYLFSRQPRSNL